MRPGYSFTLAAVDPGGARLGELVTPRGSVPTPAFMPVGSLGVVKSVSPEELRATGTAMMLANAYHLYIAPGGAALRRSGGLNAFAGWDGPILTDSGGFQVFSLAALRRITDDGVTFRSHRDGASITLTPESSIAVQEEIGATVMMAFDDCTAAPEDRDAAARSLTRTLDWAARSLAARTGPAALFGIVQGGTFEDLRREAVDRLLALPFDGYAIGGVSVGEDRAAVGRVVASTAPLLPAERPRYLMGMGTPDDLLEMIGHGVDLFDCVLPSRNARNGSLFVPGGRLNIRNAVHRDADEPVEEGCPCPLCRRYTRAFLRHLFQVREVLGLRLATLHNVTHYQRLMQGARAAIAAGEFAAFRATRGAARLPA